MVLYEVGNSISCLFLSLRHCETNAWVSCLILRSVASNSLTLFCNSCVLWCSFNELPSLLKIINCVVKNAICRTKAALTILCFSKIRLNLRYFRYVCPANLCQNITYSVETHRGFIDLGLFTRQQSSASEMDIRSKQQTACCGSFDKNGISKVHSVG